MLSGSSQRFCTHMKQVSAAWLWAIYYSCRKNNNPRLLEQRGQTQRKRTHSLPWSRWTERLIFCSRNDVTCSGEAVPLICQKNTFAWCSKETENTCFLVAFISDTKRQILYMHWSLSLKQGVFAYQRARWSTERFLWPVGLSFNIQYDSMFFLTSLEIFIVLNSQV